jgi:hypothetical protein
VKRITTRAGLRELARELEVRPDWHEPSEQNLTARVYGTSFDNAMPAGEWYGPGLDGVPQAEMYVVLYRLPSFADYSGTEPQPVAAINLATLFAWACEPSGPPWPAGEKYAKLRAFVEEIAREEV